VGREGLRIVSKALLRVDRKRPTGYYSVSSQRKEKTVEGNGPRVMWPIARVAAGRRRDQRSFEQAGRQLEWLSVCWTPLDLPRRLPVVQYHYTLTTGRWSYMLVEVVLQAGELTVSQTARAKGTERQSGGAASTLVQSMLCGV